MLGSLHAAQVVVCDVDSETEERNRMNEKLRRRRVERILALISAYTGDDLYAELIARAA